MLYLEFVVIGVPITNQQSMLSKQNRPAECIDRVNTHELCHQKSLDPGE